MVNSWTDSERAFAATATSELVPRRTLSDGAVIDATIIARLLGIKLLVAHARVTLTPANPAPTVYLVDRPSGSSGLSVAVEVLAHASRTLDSAKHISVMP